jgi:hypothetical protein
MVSPPSGAGSSPFGIPPDGTLFALLALFRDRFYWFRVHLVVCAMVMLVVPNASFRLVFDIRADALTLDLTPKQKHNEDDCP